MEHSLSKSTHGNTRLAMKPAAVCGRERRRHLPLAAPHARRYPVSIMGDEPLTDLLDRWSHGDSAAGDRLLPLVYDQLRELAGVRFRGERSNHTLQPTALVHEAFLRLRAQNQVQWQNRAQFLGYSARVMRQILVDHARSRNRHKRGGHWQRVPMTDISDFVQTPPGILALNEALEWLGKRDPVKSRVVELRFFGGLTHDEIALLLEVSETTVRRHWRTARAWLHQRLVED